MLEFFVNIKTLVDGRRNLLVMMTLYTHDIGVTCDGGAGSRLTETRGLKLVLAAIGRCQGAGAYS